MKHLSVSVNFCGNLLFCFSVQGRALVCYWKLVKKGKITRSVRKSLAAQSLALQSHANAKSSFGKTIRTPPNFGRSRPAVRTPIYSGACSRSVSLSKKVNFVSVQTSSSPQTPPGSPPLLPNSHIRLCSNRSRVCFL